MRNCSEMWQENPLWQQMTASHKTSQEDATQVQREIKETDTQPVEKSPKKKTINNHREYQ